MLLITLTLVLNLNDIRLMNDDHCSLYILGREKSEQRKESQDGMMDQQGRRKNMCKFLFFLKNWILNIFFFNNSLEISFFLKTPARHGS